MKSFFNTFYRSAKELRNIRCICVTAMLIALDLILKFTVSIKVSSTVVISFAFIAMASIGMLYGPTVAFFAGLVTDILGFLIKPSGAFDIRFTLIEALGGLLYGLFLYNAVNSKWLIPRIAVAKSAVVIVCNLWLTTWVTSSLLGKGYFALFPARAIKNLIQLPVDIVLLSLILPFILKAYCLAFGSRKVDEDSVLSDKNMGKALLAAVLILAVALTAAIYLKSK